MRKVKSNKLPALLLAAAAMMLAVSCASIDCPMDSLVYTQYQLRTASGAVDTLADTLNITEFSLPISYAQAQDVFFIETKDSVAETVWLDTVTVTKEDHPHFESVDCSPAYFHTLTGVSYTRNALDSVVIVNPDVNYDTSKKHFHIYFKHRD